MPKIDLGGLVLDCSSLAKYMRQDLKDDWFPDPLQFDDLLDSETLEQGLSSNFAKNHGVYAPGQTQIFDIPKANFVVRYAIEKNLYDRVFFSGLAVYLLRHFDKLLSPRSMSHRLNTNKNKSKKYIFKNGVQQWSEFRGIVLQRSRGRVMLETDVNSFFESINIDHINKHFVTLLRELDVTGAMKVQVRRCINLLFECLPKWTFDGTRRGLPQNRDASSFLANILMDKIDRAMLADGYDYWRYMDDIRIVCDTEHEARKALLDLTRELRSIELGVNPGKTKINTTNQEIEDSLAPNPKLQQINFLWQSKQLPSIYRSIQILFDYTSDLISSNETQSREFRFCIGRLVKLIRCTEFRLPPSSVSPLVDQLITELDSNPVSSDQFIIFLMFADLTQPQIERLISYITDDARSIYGWQNYLLWRLFAARGVRSGTLMKYAFEKISDTTSEEADLAGAALYIGAVGKARTRVMLANRFSRFRGFIDQRSALIAIHEVPWNVVKDVVKPYVLPELTGVYQGLKTNPKFKGQYMKLPDSLKLSELFDSLGTENVS